MKKISFIVSSAVFASLCFGGTYYVSPGASGSGTSWDDALGTVEEALELAAADESAIVYLDGNDSEPVVHYISLQKELEIASAITICGRTGNPEGTVLTRPDADNTAKVGYRIISLKHVSASIKDITVAGGRFYTTEKDCYGANVHISNGLVDHCIIRDGDTTSDYKNNRGAGFYMSGGRVTRTVIKNNKVKSNNGNCYASGGYVTGGVVDNCLFTGNSGHNGTLYIAGSPKIYNNTIAGNTSNGHPALYISGSPDIRNCLIAENTSDTKTSAIDLVVNSGKTSYLKGCYARVQVNEECFSGMMEFRGDDDFRPIIGSASIDGSIGLAEGCEQAEFDLQGNPRAVGEGVDVGCYEWSSTSAGEEVAITCVSAKGDAPFNASLIAAVHGLSGTLSYIWDFGDGETSETSDLQTSHIYETPGVYSVKLSVRDGAGVVHEAANTLKIVAGADLLTLDGSSLSLPEAYEAVNDGGEIVLLPAGSPYSLGAQLLIEKAVTIRGSTGNPADVVVTRPENSGNTPYRLFELSNASAVLRDITVSGGSLQGSPVELYGANILISSAGGTVLNSVVRNSKTWGGNHRCGGICIQSVNGLVSRCIITNNTIQSLGHTGGSGVYITAGRVENSLIAGNSGNNGAVLMAGANSKMFNCTVTGNSSANGCAGVYLDNNSPTVANSIIWGNTGKTDANGVYNNAERAAVAFKSCVLPSVLSGTVNDTCVYDDVVFIDPAAMNYRTAKTSCNVGKGDNEITLWTSSDKDLDGNARITDEGSLDIGCYQWTLSGLEVTFNATAASGFAPHEVVFTPAVEGATEDFVCSWDFDGDGVVDKTSSGLDPVAHTYAHGEYRASLVVTHAGADYPVANALPIRAYPQILYVTTNENSAAVYPYATPETAAVDIHTAIAAAGDGSEVILGKGTYTLSKRIEIEDGITLRGETGNARDVHLRRTDGPILMLNHVRSRVESLTMRDVSTGTWSDDYTGLALRIDVNGGTASNVVVRNIVVDNDSRYNPPVALFAGTLTHSIVTGNRVPASHNGGYGGSGVSAIYIVGSPLISNTLVAGNSTTGVGSSSPGPVFVSLGSPQFVNCTIAGNENPVCGGINASSYNAKDVFVVNSVIAENKATNHVGSVTQDAYTGTSITFVNTVSDAVALGETCLTGDLCFKGPQRGDYRLGLGSVAINAADIDLAQPPAVDLAGKPRVRGRGFDAGCYEFQGDGIAISVR